MGYWFYLHRKFLFNISTHEENEMKRINDLVVELCKQHKDAHRPLIFDQIDKLQRQYRQDNGIYTTHEGRIKQETFAYLVVKGNLEKGLYRK